jgi:ADP-ribosylation factor-binding protein GGA
MLKKQGVIKDDPNYLGTSAPASDATPTTPITPRAKNPIFEDSEKQALLQKLLQSKNQEDLQAANRLIKSMVREVSRPVDFIKEFAVK